MYVHLAIVCWSMLNSSGGFISFLKQYEDVNLSWVHYKPYSSKMLVWEFFSESSQFWYLPKLPVWLLWHSKRFIWSLVFCDCDLWGTAGMVHGWGITKLHHWTATNVVMSCRARTGRNKIHFCTVWGLDDRKRGLKLSRSSLRQGSEAWLCRASALLFVYVLIHVLHMSLCTAVTRNIWVERYRNIYIYTKTEKKCISSTGVCMCFYTYMYV